MLEPGWKEENVWEDHAAQRLNSSQSISERCVTGDDVRETKQGQEASLLSSGAARCGFSEPNVGKSSAERVPWPWVSEKDVLERAHTGRDSSGGNPGEVWESKWQ